MSIEKEQTAVDWLENIFWNNEGMITAKHLEQAKKMEKNQLENSYLQGFGQCDHDGVMDFHKYYKQNFKQQEQ